MVAKPSGSTMDVNAAPANAEAPTLVRPSGTLTFVTCAPLKALSATWRTDSGAVYVPPGSFLAAGKATSCVASLFSSTPSTAV